MTSDSDHDMSQASPLVHTTETQIVVAREVHTHPLKAGFNAGEAHMHCPTSQVPSDFKAALSQDRDKLGEL